MANYGCYCKTNCAGLVIVAGIIIGIITGMLRFMGTITLTPAFLWVLFGIAVVYLGITFVASAFTSNSSLRACGCSNIPIYLIGVLGTILTSVILLGVTFSATSIIGTIISGLLLAFFTLIVGSAACFIRCQLNCYND